MWCYVMLCPHERHRLEIRLLVIQFRKLRKRLPCDLKDCRKPLFDQNTLSPLSCRWIETQQHVTAFLLRWNNRRNRLTHAINVTVFLTKNGHKNRADDHSGWAKNNINQNESKALIVWGTLRLYMLYWSSLVNHEVFVIARLTTSTL